MRIDAKMADYLKAAVEMVTVNPERIERWISDVCSECCEEVSEFEYANDSHVFTDREGDTPIMLIGCEGYLMINPNVLGVSAPNWQDWMTELENDH